jgi:hypothetical protein
VRGFIDKLLSDGAQVDKVCGCATALGTLVQTGCTSCVQHLITAHNANVSTQYGENLHTALHESVLSLADTSAAVLGVMLAADTTGTLLAQQDSNGAALSNRHCSTLLVQSWSAGSAAELQQRECSLCSASEAGHARAHSAALCSEQER